MHQTDNRLVRSDVVFLPVGMLPEGARNAVDGRALAERIDVGEADVGALHVVVVGNVLVFSLRVADGKLDRAAPLLEVDACRESPGIKAA